jgi:hypothetical protein
MNHIPDIPEAQLNHIPEAQLNQIVNDVFDDFDVPPPPPPNPNDQNVLNEVAEYDEEFVRPFPPDKRKHVIGVSELEPKVVYYKVMNYDTQFDINKLEYVGNPDKRGVIYQFKNNLGNDNIPLTNQSRFIPVYLMLNELSYPNPVNYKYTNSAVEGIDKEATSNDEDSSDSDLEGGKKLSQKKQKKFHFTSTQKHQHGGKKTVRHVSIKNGKGHKKVSHYRGNKLVRTIKKSLKKTDMEMIRLGKFIPGLFRDCQVSRKKSTTRHRRKK